METKKAKEVSPKKARKDFQRQLLVEVLARLEIAQEKLQALAWASQSMDRFSRGSPDAPELRVYLYDQLTRAWRDYFALALFADDEAMAEARSKVMEHFINDKINYDHYIPGDWAPESFRHELEFEDLRKRIAAGLAKADDEAVPF